MKKPCVTIVLDECCMSKVGRIHRLRVRTYIPSLYSKENKEKKTMGGAACDRPTPSYDSLGGLIPGRAEGRQVSPSEMICSLSRGRDMGWNWVKWENAGKAAWWAGTR